MWTGQKYQPVGVGMTSLPGRGGVGEAGGGGAHDQRGEEMEPHLGGGGLELGISSSSLLDGGGTLRMRDKVGTGGSYG